MLLSPAHERMPKSSARPSSSGSAANIADGDKFITADYIGHTSSGDRDRAGLHKRIESFGAKYSNVHFQIMDQVASGDRVASRLEATATETATGQSIRMIGMNISRFRDGKIAEEWAVWEIVRPAAPQ